MFIYSGSGSSTGMVGSPSVPTVVVSESLPMAMDHDGTLQLCSPSILLQTDVAMETLKKVDEHEKAVEDQVPLIQNFSIFIVHVIYIYIYS